MGPARTTRTVGICLAALGAAFLAACSSEHRRPTVGTLIFDETVTLERGERRDMARREITVDGKATFVAIAEEDDLGLVLRMSHVGVPGTPAAKVEVDSRLYGEGIEIATLDAPPGTRLTVELESAHDFDRPGKARLRILRFDGELAASSRAAARLAAFRAWSAATSTSVANEDWLGPAIRNIDLALTHFESADGDPLLAAWGRMARGRLNNRQRVNLTTTVSDARIAARGFEALGATRNASRARILEASTLLDIANVSTARNPSAEEAAHLAKELLTALSVDPALSAYERAPPSVLGLHDYNVYNNADARTYFQAAKSAFEAIGNRGSRRAAVQNLAAIAFEEGDFQAAARSTTCSRGAGSDRFGRVSNGAVEQRGCRRYQHWKCRACDRTHVPGAANYARAQIAAVRRARALCSRERLLVRGDMAQATTFHVEALKVRRTSKIPLR